MSGIHIRIELAKGLMWKWLFHYSSLSRKWLRKRSQNMKVQIMIFLFLAIWIVIWISSEHNCLHEFIVSASVEGGNSRHEINATGDEINRQWFSFLYSLITFWFTFDLQLTKWFLLMYVQHNFPSAWYSFSVYLIHKGWNRKWLKMIQVLSTLKLPGNVIIFDSLDKASNFFYQTLVPFICHGSGSILNY